MPEIVLRVGGVARLEPEPQRPLARIARACEPEELAEWLADLRRGRWVLVRLDLFADVLGPDGVRRCEDAWVDALSFGLPHGEDNLDHAREMVVNNLAGLARALCQAGIAADPRALSPLPVAVELAPDLAERLIRG